MAVATYPILRGLQYGAEVTDTILGDYEDRDAEIVYFASYIAINDDELTTLEPYIDLADDHNVPVWLELETMMNNNVYWPKTYSSPTVTEYGTYVIEELTVKEVFDTLESDDRVVGYTWEGGFTNGVEWLRGETDKKLCQMWSTGLGTISSKSATLWAPGEEYDERISYCDEVSWEIYQLTDIENVEPLLTYLKELKPSLKIGTVTTQTDNTTVVGWYNYWLCEGETTGVLPYLTLTQRRRRCAAVLQSLKQSYGTFDSATCMAGPGTAGSTVAPKDDLDFLIALKSCEDIDTYNRTNYVDMLLEV